MQTSLESKRFAYEILVQSKQVNTHLRRKCVMESFINAKNCNKLEKRIIFAPHFAGVAELVDAQDLKSCGNLFPCRFESGPRYKGQLKIKNSKI